MILSIMKSTTNGKMETQLIQPRQIQVPLILQLQVIAQVLLLQLILQHQQIQFQRMILQILIHQVFLIPH